MDGTDEGAMAAADLAEPEAAPAGGLCLGALADHRPLPSAPVQTQRAAVGGGGVAGAGREVLEAGLGDADDVGGDELGPLARAVLGVLEAALPLQHGPAAVAVGG